MSEYGSKLISGTLYVKDFNISYLFRQMRSNSGGELKVCPIDSGTIRF
jgi:hypothetical protein